MKRKDVEVYLTEYGFKFGAMEVSRTQIFGNCSTLVSIKTARHKGKEGLEISCTTGGLLKVYYNGKRIKL